MPVAPTSTAELLELVHKSGLIPAERLVLLPTAESLPAAPPAAAAVLLEKGFITRFQAKQLLQGRHKGFRLGAYAIQDQLGRGGMGAVYLAEHLELHRKVALKVLLFGKGDDHKLATERFMREARSAAALDHPNIVRIFDVARHDQVPYLVMEYVEGETLQQVIDRDGAIPYPTAVDYIAQAAAGLQHAHEKGFVHRDIKPGNLIRDKTGTVKILDMGLARSFANPKDKLTEQLDSGAVVGTADYIAPEQALNQPTVDIRADVYSLGASFFALISGKPPFEGNTAQKLLQHQLKSAPQLAAIDTTLPRGLSAVVAKMLAKKAADRFQTPAEVIAALTPWLVNSNKVMAGLSRTNLAQGADLQAALTEIARNSSRRLNPAYVVVDEADSGDVNPAAPARQTDTVSSSETTRAPVRKKTPAKPKRNMIPLYAGLGVLVLALGGLTGWLAFGRGKPAGTTTGGDQTQAPATDPGKTPDPNAERKSPVQPPVPGGDRVVYRLDAAELPAFKTTKLGRNRTAGDDTPRLPGLFFGGHKADTVSEWVGGPVGGVQAIGFTNRNTPHSAQIGIDLEGPNSVGLTLTPGNKYRLTVTYQTAGAATGQMYFQTNRDWSLPAGIVELPNSNGTWRTVEQVATKDARPLRCLVDSSTNGPNDMMYVRSVVVSEVGTGPPVNPSPGKGGRSVYKLDLDKIAPFRVQKEGLNLAPGHTAEMLPDGVRCYCWKPKAVGEFRCEKVDGVPALGVTCFNDEVSAQFAFELEQELKAALTPGKKYEVRVTYLTKNEAAGQIAVQTPTYESVAGMALPNSDGWKQATVAFTRGQEPLRVTIDNTTVGDVNTLYIRSFEVVELDPAGKK